MKKKKKQKKSPGHYRLCPGPRNSFKDKYLRQTSGEALAKSKDLGVAAIILFLRFAGFPGLRSEWRIRLDII